MSNRSKYSTSIYYRLRRFRSLFNFDGFATSSLLTQGILIVMAGTLVVFAFAPLLGSVKLSAQMFMKTAGVEALETWGELAFGTIDFLIGLLIFSLVITILTSALDQFIERVREGTLKYTKSGHIVIINSNDMMSELLAEINERGEEYHEVYHIVILGGDVEAVETIQRRLQGRKYYNLEIFVRQGDLHNFQTFKHINLCGASGVLLLQDYESEDGFARDGSTIKTLLALSGWPEFVCAIRERRKARKPFRFVAEFSGTVACKHIIEDLGKEEGANVFIPANPEDVSDHLLGRAIADSRFYDIFHDIFSFSGHEIMFLDPARYGAKVEGISFREICYGFTKGVILGRSRFENGNFDLQLGPMDEALKAGDWLIALAEDDNLLIYDPAKHYKPPSEKISQPKEIVFRRICMLGNREPFPSLTTFLDEESQKIFQENTFIFEDGSKYFELDFFTKIKAGNFDSVVLNLRESLAFRLAAFIHTLFPPDDPFLQKIVTVIENPVIDELLNSESDKHNTILSRRICAKYLIQILFQKSLVPIIDELCSPKGYEINLMEVGSEISKDNLGSKDQLKQLLLGSDIIYMGYFDHEENMVFDSDDLSNAKTIIVLAKGDM